LTDKKRVVCTAWRIKNESFRRLDG
jgi:hypothetical protein